MQCLFHKLNEHLKSRKKLEITQSHI